MKNKLPIRRTDKIPADDFWMGLAFWTLANSAYPSDAASIIVSPSNKFVSSGISGPPDPLVTYLSEAERDATLLHSEYFASSDVNASGCTVYITEPPCLRCVLELMDKGVKRIVYYPGVQLSFELEDLAKRAYVALNVFMGNLNWMRDHMKQLENRGIF